MGDMSDNQKKMFRLMQKQSGGGLQIFDSTNPSLSENLSEWTLNIQHAADVRMKNEKSFI